MAQVRCARPSKCSLGFAGWERVVCRCEKNSGAVLPLAQCQQVLIGRQQLGLVISPVQKRAQTVKCLSREGSAYFYFFLVSSSAVGSE